MSKTPGRHPPAGRTFAIVVSKFNEFITKKLLDGARDCLHQHGIADRSVDIVSCPGAFEIPQISRRLAESGKYRAIICLGCIIRGETPHFEYIANAAANGIEQAAQTTGIPMAFGVLTTDNVDQAVERAGGKLGNKGWDAAMSALEMADLFSGLGKKKRKA
jgi:6,7-dimethyl-8-ribityllumazine synthase